MSYITALYIDKKKYINGTGTLLFCRKKFSVRQNFEEIAKTQHFSNIIYL